MDDEGHKEPPEGAADAEAEVTDLELRRRKQKVRDKLSQLYGDSSVATVRKFLHELSDDDDGGDPTPPTDASDP